MLLSVRKITKDFPFQRTLLGRPISFVRALDDVSLDIGLGQIIGVVGESGCGKTTLGRCVVGLQEPTLGEIWWDGKDSNKLAPFPRKSIQYKFQMVFQNPFSSLNPRQKIEELLQEPLEVHNLLKLSQRHIFVQNLIEQVGLSKGDLKKYPHEFSGGQRQRIGLARALTCHPDLIVLDEPVSSLDVSIQASILNLLVKLNEEKKISYLFISHDLQVVGYLSQRLLVMYLGRVVEDGTTEKVLKKPKHPYTRALLQAGEGKDVKISGEAPNPAHIPTGCPFHPRCAFAEDRCRREKQEFLSTENDWKVACWKWNNL